MPTNEYAQNSSYYYSLDYGKAHWIMLNTEAYYHTDDNEYVVPG
jgi:hypothetical protein